MTVQVDLKVLAIMLASRHMADAMMRFNEAARPVAEDSAAGRIDYHNATAAGLLREGAEALRLVARVAMLASEALTPPSERECDPDTEAEEAAGA
jgi:hypothetical protein